MFDDSINDNVVIRLLGLVVEEVLKEDFTRETFLSY
jgi:hypothetical protein